MNQTMNTSSSSSRPISSFPRGPLALLTAGSLLAIALLAGCGQGGHRHAHNDDHDHDHGHGHAHDTAPVAPADSGVVSAPYTLTTCPVSGEELGSMGEPVVYLHEGREIQFCCEACVEPFEENPGRYLAAVDAAMIEQQKPNYPLQTCVVTGMKLGSMGEPYAHIYRNHLVMFCCDGCIPAFQKDPAAYLQKIEQARAQ
jgi:YHS domain-containing protein